MPTEMNERCRDFVTGLHRGAHRALFQCRVDFMRVGDKLYPGARPFPRPLS